MVFFPFFFLLKTDESYIHTSYAFDFRLRNKAQRKPLAEAEYVSIQGRTPTKLETSFDIKA